MSFLPHPALLPYVPGSILRSLHRDVCRLRGSRWGTPNPGAPYVKSGTWLQLISYHAAVLTEMRSRGFRFARLWADPSYRGRTISRWDDLAPSLLASCYQEHDAAYYSRSKARMARRIGKGTHWTPDDLIRFQTAPEAPR